MRVTVRFLGSLGDQVGVPFQTVELPMDGTYRDVLDIIGPTMQARLPAWGWDLSTRSFSRRMLISINGKADLRDESTSLTDGDEILVVLPLSGG